MPEETKKLRIESLAYGGSGVGRLEGKVVFVPLTAPGDVIHFRKVREKKGYIEGELVEIVGPSELRREPPCPVFGECGGCAWQHLPYEKQLGAKEEIFRETLWRLGTVDKERIAPIVPSPKEWNYRNRAQFKARFVDGRLHLGFYRRKSHFVIDIENCPIMSPLINDLMLKLKNVLSSAPFRETMPQIDLSVNDSDDRAVVIIHLTQNPASQDREFVSRTLSGEDSIKSLFFQSGRKSTISKIFSRGEERLNYRLKVEDREIVLGFSPGGFTQVNYEQNRALVSKAVEVASKGRLKKILDLYCGIGNFSLPLAVISGEVLGIEEYERAIADARLNAEGAGLSNCRFVAEDAIREISKIDMGEYDLALVDPPREGAAAVVKRLVSSGVPVVIYVSCNPTTLARDLRIMTRKGYEVISSQPFDLFPQTGHIESVTLIEKR